MGLFNRKSYQERRQEFLVQFDLQFAAELESRAARLNVSVLPQSAIESTGIDVAEHVTRNVLREHSSEWANDVITSTHVKSAILRAQISATIADQAAQKQQKE